MTETGQPAFLTLNMSASEVTPDFGDYRSTNHEHPASNAEGFNASVGTAESTPAIRAQAKPHASCLYIHINPGDTSQLLELITVVIREELLHGERKKFGLSRNIHLLQRQSIVALFAYLADEIDAETAASRIIKRQVAAYEITKVQRGFLEAIDQYLHHQVIAEPQWFNEPVNEFVEWAGGDPEQIKSDLKEHCLNLGTSREDTRYQDIYDQLNEIGERYSPPVAQHVADAALNIPYAVSVTEIDGAITTAPLAEYGPKERLERRLNEAVSAVENVDNPLAKGQNLINVLQSEVRAVDDWSQEAVTGETITDIPMPLLDATTKVEDVEAKHAFEAAPTPMDQAIAAAFIYPGNFGGVNYRDKYGERNLIINPLLDEEYRNRWESFYIGDRLLDYLTAYLWDRHPNSGGAGESKITLGEMVCPLCTKTHATDSSSCPHNTQIGRLNDRTGRLRDAFVSQDEYSQWIELITDIRGDSDE